MQIGYVSTREQARPHLAINGRAHCGAGSGRITGGTVELTSEGGVTLAADLCRRCRRRVEVLATEALHAVMDRRDLPSRLMLRTLNRVLDLLELPATRARVAMLAADVRAANRARVAARRPRHALSGLGQLAAAHRAAGQLALI